MIKHWKAEEKGGAWRVIDDSAEKISELISNNVVRHMTPLSVSQQVTDETPLSSLLYYGDMYFDIDVKPEEIGGTHKDAIAVATKSCRELVDKLHGVQATGLKIYASGSKGFHVILPKENFGSMKPQPYLFDTYRQVAIHFKVDWLDMGMYSGRKGKMLRMPNVERANGAYKVPLTHNELLALTPDEYLKLVSKPRLSFEFSPAKKSPALAAILSSCRTEATKLRKEREKLSTTLPKEDLKRQYDEEGLPGCIERLIRYGDERDASNFNQAALQLATYCKDAGIPKEDVKKICTEMAKNVGSKSYGSSAERYNALYSLYESVQGSNYHFSKGGLFSVINRCGSCSICSVKHELQGDVAVEIDERLQLAVGRKGYEIGFGKSIQPATNFHLRTKAVKVKYPVTWHSTPMLNRRDRRPAGLLVEMTVFDSMGPSEPIDVNMNEDAVNSPILARDVITAAGGSWLSSPELWNKLRMVLTDRGNLNRMNAEEITTVPYFGTSVFIRDGDPVTVYCDPESHLLSDPSVEEVFRTEFPDDPKQLKEKNAAARMPNLAHLPPYTAKIERGSRGYSPEELSLLINHLTCILPDAETATVMGWFCAAHLKPHLRANGMNFPLLNLYGQPESGKTAAASLMLCLHGVHSSSDAPVVDASQSTPVSIREKLSQSNSVPTILDEMNQSMDYRKYQELVNLLKSSWDHSATSKMSGQGGIRDLVSTSPIVTCGEQTISTEHRSLRTRTLEVAFNLNWKDDLNRRKHFMYVSGKKAKLASFGLDLLVEAVQGVDVDWVGERFAARLEDIHKVYGSARKQEGYTACLVGLDLLRQALKRLGANCDNRLNQLEKALIRRTQTMHNGAIDTEIDRIIRQIVAGINNTVAEYDPDGPKIPAGIGGFVSSRDEVKFLPEVAYSSIRRADRGGQRSVFRIASEDFEKTLRQAPPDYVDLREDGFAYIKMADVKSKGWWIEPQSSPLDDLPDM